MISNATVFDCSLIHLSKKHSIAGNITAVQNDIDVPFDVRRVYYLYDIPGGESRGAHGHKKLQQLIIAVSGSFDVTLFDGANTKTVNLSRPYMGLHIIPGMWRDISNFSSGAICLVLASHEYDNNDYIRSIDEFINYKNHISL